MFSIFRLFAFLLLFVSIFSCREARYVDNGCLWSKIITLTQEELEFALSKETLREIRNHNREVEIHCFNKNKDKR